jgi:hypothetical protein
LKLPLQTRSEHPIHFSHRKQTLPASPMVGLATLMVIIGIALAGVITRWWVDRD